MESWYEGAAVDARASAQIVEFVVTEGESIGVVAESGAVVGPVGCTLANS
jgi:hypothetical protein